MVQWSRRDVLIASTVNSDVFLGTPLRTGHSVLYISHTYEETMMWTSILYHQRSPPVLSSSSGPTPTPTCTVHDYIQVGRIRIQTPLQQPCSVAFWPMQPWERHGRDIGLHASPVHQRRTYRGSVPPASTSAMAGACPIAGIWLAGTFRPQYSSYLI